MDKKRLLGSYDGTKLYLFAILVMLALQVAVGIVYSFVTELMSLSESAEVNLNFLLSLTFQIGFLSVTCVYLKKSNTKLLYSPFHEDKSLKRAGSITIGTVIGIICTCVCLLGFYALASCFDSLLVWTGYDMDYFSGYSVSNIIIMSILTVIAAPICEELVFRGALLSGLKRKLGDLPCILLSGLAFSLMHMNPSQTVYQFFLGCTIAYITLQSKSLIPAIFMHAANNLIALLLEIVPGFNNLAIRLIEWVMVSKGRIALFTVLSAVLAIIIIYLLGKVVKAINKKMFGKDEYKIEEEKEEPEPQPAMMPAYAHTTYNGYRGGGDMYGGPVIYGGPNMPFVGSAGQHGPGYINPADIDPFAQSDAPNQRSAAASGDSIPKIVDNGAAVTNMQSEIGGAAQSPDSELPITAISPDTSAASVDNQDSGEIKQDGGISEMPQGYRYDPQTGQPISYGSGSAGGQPQGYRYDPQTGQPISYGGGYAPNQNNNPNAYGYPSGQPYGPAYGYGQPLRKRKKMSYKKLYGIGIAVCAAMWVFNYLAVLFLNMIS